jgi:CubicO group peptidase (beta-lactamase class C family)
LAVAVSTCRRPEVVSARFAPVFVLVGGLALLFFAAACGTTPGQHPSGTTPLDLGQPWAQGTPAEAGMDAGLLQAASDRVGAIARARSLLVARHGTLVLERYLAGSDANTLFDLRSVTKSVVSALTGIALRDGRLPGLDASIAPYLEPAYRLGTADDDVAVRHLLTMTSGYEWNDDTDYNPWILSNDHVQYLLDRPNSAAPGATFTYDSAAVHVLGVVLERASGTPLPVLAEERLFGALGAERVTWEALDRGTVNGGSGIKLRARDLLRFGQLYLQRGWSGTRSVVPEDWVAESTRPQFAWRNSYGAQQGVTYGMLWWVSDASPPSFFAWGYGGQLVYIVPSLDLVVVTTTSWSGLSATAARALASQLLTVIVEDILPASR